MCALQRTFLGIAFFLTTTAAFSASPFDGTWRPDPERGDPNGKPDEYVLSSGSYQCRSCTPPYSVPADGQDHPVAGNQMYDSLSVKIVDDRTVSRVAKKGGKTVAETRANVSSDGNSLSEEQTLFFMGPKPIELMSKSTRVGQQRPGDPAISGKWRRVETDLINHDEDTTLHVADQTVSMTDRMGRSFRAKLDGTDAPYNGSPEFTSVSVKLINPTTLEESDKNAGKVVKICTWSVDPDGKTMHARFDDLHGRIQKQTGHKIS
jgi:hypothetical protein